MSSKKPTVPTIPTNYKPPAAFNWNSSAGRQPMDMSSIMGAAAPLAGNVQAPTYSTPAPPISGNFWDTVASPDSVLSALNGLKPIGKNGTKGGVGDPFGLGVDISPYMTGTGKGGSPSMSPTDTGGRGPKHMVSGPHSQDGRESAGSTSSVGNGRVNNPMLMQMFMQSGMMDKIGKAFAIGGVDPAQQRGGNIPFY
jgi:hypothetical protein